MAALGAATGSEFDRLYLEGMIVHHEGAIMMARMIQGSSNEEVKALGASITTTPREEIKRMEQLLAR